MKLYECWEGDLLLGFFYENEVLEMREGGLQFSARCISD